MSSNTVQIIRGLETLLGTNLTLDYNEHFIIKYDYNINIKMENKYNGIHFNIYDIVVIIKYKDFENLILKNEKNDLLIYLFDNFKNISDSMEFTGFRSTYYRLERYLAFVVQFDGESIKFDTPKILSITMENKKLVLTYDTQTTEYSIGDEQIYKDIATAVKKCTAEIIIKNVGFEPVSGFTRFNSNYQILEMTFRLDDHYINFNIQFTKHYQGISSLPVRNNYQFDNVNQCNKVLCKLLLLSSKIINYDDDMLNSCSHTIKQLHKKIIDDTKKFNEITLPKTKPAVINEPAIINESASQE